MARSASTGGGQGGRRRQPLPPTGGGQSTSPRRFVQESVGELRKVQWPTRAHVLQGTLVVALVTAVFIVYLTLLDFVIVRAMDFLKEQF